MKGKLKFKGLVAGAWLMLLVSSCQSNEKKPADVLSQNEMVKVLAEIYITEEKVARLSLSADSAAQVFDLLEDRIFEKLQVPDSVFRKSLNYYTDRPAEMDKIYGVLIDSLQLREQRAPQNLPVVQ